MADPKLWSIYVLRDPVTLCPVYIGRTTDPETRLHGHSVRSSNPSVRKWAAKSGEAPRMDILATATTLSEASRIESDTIRFYKERVPGLMNIAIPVPKTDPVSGFGKR